MTNRKRFLKRLNIYVTAEMQRKLEQIRDQRGPQESVPDVVREAIRVFMDDQEQLIGSRRHFQKGLRDEISAEKQELTKLISNLQNDSTWGHIFTLALIAQSLVPILSRVTGQPVTVHGLLDQALKEATQDWAHIYGLILHLQDNVDKAERKTAKEKA